MTEPRQKILLVDDIPSNIKVLSSILKHELDVFVATNGFDALDVALHERPDLVLLDVMMPDMDGYEVCRRLKADPRTQAIPVIFVSAMGEIEDETRGLEAGAIDYLTKPISPPIVRARIRNHLELKRQRDILEQISLIDGLTGIANRRRFDEVGSQEWRRSLRNATSIALILIDIDDFKKFNDLYGHVAGDECLKMVAQTIASQARRGGDLVARYGGEEFVALLTETATPEAVLVAENIRQAVASLNISHKNSSAIPFVTISLGVASLIPTPNDDLETLINMADHLLYQAKKSGRNRVDYL
ncbi:two-component system, chemotaxis family, response regulator WspR [Azospirillaceae bacterium]